MSATGMRIVAVGLAAALLAGPGGAEGDADARSAYAAAPLLEEIRLRQTELDRREQELRDRERHVSELEETVEARLAELEALADTVDRRIDAWQETSGDTIRRLAKIYAAMPPERAAPLLEELDVELATQIVAGMKHKQSAAVLSLVSEDRALAMSRNVAHPLGMEPASPKARGR